MSCVIRIRWLEGSFTIGDNVEGSYVKWYDPDAFGGRGDMKATTKIEEAKKFTHAGAAMEFYRQVSTVRPLRNDGRPNRPLTAFTVSIENVEDA